MADAGTRAADMAQAEMERKMRRIYRQAQQEIIEKLNAHTQRMYALDAQKRAELAAGKITAQQYKSWLLGQQFTQKMWKQKVDSVATTLLTANQQANAIVEGEKRAVFGENATYAAYEMEHGMGRDLSFSVYDSATVTKLLREDPELLPRRVVNGEKDKAWNRKKISAAVTQGIIQGESIPQIAQRIARQTASSNMKAMTRYARTAMTSAQNAGRIEAMHHAQDMGIKMRKKWLATLDNRTRDAHAMLDGQVQDVDKPFQSQLGPIMFPGDPSADPGNVYNCRCTLTYVYPEYHAKNAQRLARNEETKEWEKVQYVSYAEWYAKKELKGQIGETPKQNPKTKEEIIASYSQERRIYDKVSGMQYDASNLDEIVLQESGREEVNGEWIPFSRETGTVTVPENTNDNDVLIYQLPSGKKSFYGNDSTKTTILTNGRVAINYNTGRNETRRKITDVIENEIDALGGIRKQGIFWRVTSNEKDIEYIKKGTIKPSKNHMTGETEDGLSVWERPKYFDKYTERLTGEIIGTGSDGEPLLDVKTVKVAEDLGKTVEDAQKEGRQKFLDLYGWSEEQLQKALEGRYSIKR